MTGRAEKWAETIRGTNESNEISGIGRRLLA